VYPGGGFGFDTYVNAVFSTDRTGLINSHVNRMIENTTRQILSVLEMV
jgi:hypothetical protein